MTDFYIYVYESNPNNTNYSSYIKKSDTKDTQDTQDTYTSINYTVKKYGQTTGGTFKNINQYLKDEITNFQTTFKSNPNNKYKGKTMNQRYVDLYNMQMNLQSIMKSLFTDVYKKDLPDIINILNDYNNTTQKIQYGLDELNGNRDSLSYTQKIMLDSTIYSTVLWTILAISLLYYVFVRI
jgi:hypothetical protein